MIIYVKEINKAYNLDLIKEIGIGRAYSRSVHLEWDIQKDIIYNKYNDNYSGRSNASAESEISEKLFYNSKTKVFYIVLDKHWAAEFNTEEGAIKELALIIEAIESNMKVYHMKGCISNV